MNKVCSTCDKSFPATKEYFYANKRRKDGLHNWCKNYFKKYEQSEKGKITKHKYYKTERRKTMLYKNDLKRHYGLSLEEYDQMFEVQNGMCAICHIKNKDESRLCVDHNHYNDKIRGLLCRRCNAALGFFDESVEKLLSAAIYLEKHNE